MSERSESTYLERCSLDQLLVPEYVEIVRISNIIIKENVDAVVVLGLDQLDWNSTHFLADSTCGNNTLSFSVDGNLC